MCFNIKFNDHDDLIHFNQIVEDCHYRLKNTIENVWIIFINLQLISGLKTCDAKELDVERDLVYCPKFLFYFDCSFVAAIFKNCLGDSYNIYNGKRLYVLI